MYKRQTTIIETGLDIANANTIIIDSADKYGLSQLHQLRAVSYTHLRAHETVLDLVCRLLLEKKKSKNS